jgi:hypothetical protein
MKQIYLLIVLLAPVFVSGQYVFNAAFQSVKFGGPGVTITNKVSDGTTSGSVVLYQNVVNIDGQQIDAIIRTISVSSGAYMLFDQAGTGTGYTNNNSTWFSPQFLFPAGGGSALFEFEFILGNSYNNTTKTGTPVTLQNMMINSYDIDGNDAAGSNQFSEFGGFYTSEVSTVTSLTTSYNAATNLTRFNSTINTNVVNAADPNTRVRVSYQEMNNFRISVGSGGEGVAYFFIDFDKGVDFGVPTTITTAPTIDLTPSASGTDNSSSLCAPGSMKFTASGTNIAPLLTTASGGTTLERLRVTFNSTDIKDGASEILRVGNRDIALNFTNGATLSTINISSTSYTATAVVSGTEKSLYLSKTSSATMTLAEGEKLLDGISYKNSLATPTPGNRPFKVRAKDGAYESQAYTFTAIVGYTPAISQQPQAAVIATGAGTSFTTVSNAVSYQWQVNDGSGFQDVANSAIYSGATTATLTLTNVPFTMNNYTYRVVTSANTCTQVTSTAALSVLQTLPVKWLGFSAGVEESNVLVKWATSQEINAGSYTVQHSADGKNFESIGHVSAAGNSSVNNYYSFTDEQPAAGNNYYRILQTDNDGKASYSKIVSVYFGGEGNTKVMNNPVSNGQLRVQMGEPSSLRLFSADGKLVRKEQAGKGMHTMNVSGLSRGMYTLLSGTEVKRILINQ